MGRPREGFGAGDEPPGEGLPRHVVAESGEDLRQHFAAFQVGNYPVAQFNAGVLP